MKRINYPKKKVVTAEAYNKKMEKIFKTGKYVHEILIKALEYAGSVTIKKPVLKVTGNLEPE